MKKNIIFSLSLLAMITSASILATQVNDYASIKAAIEKALSKTTTKWHVINIGQAPHRLSDKTIVLDYLPQGQSSSNWKSMLQYGVFAKAPYAEIGNTTSINAAQYVQMAKKTLVRRCSAMHWKILSSSPHKVIFQYQIKACKLWGTQYRVEKVVDNVAYLSAINYTQRAMVNKIDQAKYQALIDSIVIE